MMIKYDFKYKVLNLINNIYLKFVKIGDINYYISKTFSLFTKKIKLYKILKKINSLTYKLKLSLNIIKIYLIISVIYLKQTKFNLFNRDIFSLISIITQK